MPLPCGLLSFKLQISSKVVLSWIFHGKIVDGSVFPALVSFPFSLAFRRFSTILFTLIYH